MKIDEVRMEEPDLTAKLNVFTNRHSNRFSLNEFNLGPA
jgi:hypothetical protein